MKAALIISGYLRSLKLNIPNIKKFIIDKFDDVDIYIHITKNEKNEDRYLNTQELKESIEFIESSLLPKLLLCENNILISKNKKQNDVLNNWLKFYKLNQLKNINETIHGKYDIVIKTRPDVNLQHVEFNFKDYNNNIIIPNNSKIDKDKLKNAQDSYLCDIFAYSTSELMDKYFDLYNHLNYYFTKCGNVSETLLHHHFNIQNIPYKQEQIDYSVILSSCNIFAICGDSGSGKSTLGEILKNYFSNSFVLECDRYHKWERNNPNWSNITHLNPEANYIAKMTEDIFNLKIGNTIYQVDYDHVVGKFTEKQTINSSDNIIVCGLHSLYGNTSHLYNLSVFMDTDKVLKYRWKSKRDMQKRGYTSEQIKQQIEIRQTDYSNFIDPQKYNSDVIINFFYDDKAIQMDNISLKICVNKKYTLSNILGIFSKYQIPLDFKSNNNFNEIIFTEYKDCELWNKSIDAPTKYYYYVLCILLNIQKEKIYD
tara:strand:- start:3776 stop:5224 length:1449 start_codon:yes stop_codon:yes gene_type:complete